MTDYVIVGAGLFGATCARILTDAGYTVRVVERRGAVGGNCADETRDGVLCGLYGGHIFHTNNARVWKFVNKYSEWTPYEHRVKSFHAGRVYSFPINMMTLQQLYNVNDIEEARAIIGGKRDELHRRFFAGYTAKQWGDNPPPNVTKRIPEPRLSWDDRYFSDKHQAVPTRGYSRFVEMLLDGISLDLSVDFSHDIDYWMAQAKKSVIYSGSIDELLGYAFGPLLYRSANFINGESDDEYIGCATMNYPDEEIKWTRIIEWHHIGHQHRAGKCQYTIEMPTSHWAGKNEPMWPVRDDTTTDIYNQYASELPGKIYVGGRLGSYQYLNMDQTIAQALHLCGKVLKDA